MESGGIGYDNQAVKYEIQPGMEQMPPPTVPMPPHVGQMPPAMIQMPPNQMSVVRETPPWSWCSTITASIALLFCSLFGFIGILFAVLSYTDHKVQDYRRAEHKRKCAMSWSISAIVIGVVFFIIIIILNVIVLQKSDLTTRGYNGT